MVSVSDMRLELEDSKRREALEVRIGILEMWPDSRPSVRPPSSRYPSLTLPTGYHLAGSAISGAAGGLSLRPKLWKSGARRQDLRISWRE